MSFTHTAASGNFTYTATDNDGLPDTALASASTIAGDIFATNALSQILVGTGVDTTYQFGLTSGNDQIFDAGSTTADTIAIQTGGAALTALNFLDDNTGNDDGGLVIPFNSNTLTVHNQYDGNGNAIETISLSLSGSVLPVMPLAPGPTRSPRTKLVLSTRVPAMT